MTDGCPIFHRQKSINALVAVRRMSSLFPALANRRPSIDSALLAEKKAVKAEDEDRKNSVPTLPTDKTDSEDLNASRRPRSHTFSNPNQLSADKILIGNSLGVSGKSKEPNNNNANESKECNSADVKREQSHLPREPIVLKINPNDLQTNLPGLYNGNHRNTNSLDLAFTPANTKTKTERLGITPGQKLTVHLNTSTTANTRDSGDSIPSIVLNDSDPLTPEVFVTPGSPRKISSENYFFAHETTVDSSTYVLDSWTDSNGKTEQLNKPDSKVCIRTVDQKGQTITVKLDGFSSVELPVNSTTSMHVRRASTGSEAIEFFTKTVQQKMG